jgi:glucose-1-phosphate cytidylyltransferase
MKAVILAGGKGTRLLEETNTVPKPLVEVGGKPILWHIMKTYSLYGINEFIICCGYKGYLIKEYFANYFLHQSDVSFNIIKNSMHVHQNNAEPWNVTLLDTGEDTMTGGRIKRIYNKVKNDKAFCLTYGDGLSDINISDLISFHNSHGKLATVTAARPPARFGAIKFNEKDGDKVINFEEKPVGDGSWVNSGFFVLNPDVIHYIEGDETIWEKKPLANLANKNQLYAYRHKGFWQPMDTLRDKVFLNELWDKDKAAWKKW